MRHQFGRHQTAEQHVWDIRRSTCGEHSAEDKIRIVLSGLRDENSIAELRRRGTAQSLRCSRSKEFVEAGRKRLAAIANVRPHKGEAASQGLGIPNLKLVVVQGKNSDR
jgi:transposase